MASDFEGIENAQTSSLRLPSIQPGAYVFEVLALKKIVSRTKGKMFVAEFKVLESKGAGANSVGSSCSQIIKMSLDTALGHISNLASAVIAEPATRVTGSMVDKLVSDDQPARGVKIKAEAGLIAKKDGSPFTLVKFQAYTN